MRKAARRQYCDASELEGGLSCCPLAAAITLTLCARARARAGAGAGVGASARAARWRQTMGGDRNDARPHMCA
ncbi:hypothetical protein FA10DRAFT_62079 [Acaromyces ingoldii]|uniref:Uncharacterized protein n=1 Tax=Acaromyces ingoldii TaxID=215250 RepID=A0A316YNV0_9BASI|nr:hypothetical protein FA10DRAFT_62079 [Acaromyces ingoldii]PWN91220.1 hypothetical protein FA10DRAFT_62079 [Acaromyces ingoldii]